MSLLSTDRVWSKDTDTVTVSANLEYWIQTDKIKLLEDMFEDIAVATNGIRIPVQIGEENRQVLIAIGSLNISELEETSEFGEMAVCDINIDLVFYPEVVSKSDYTVEFLVNDKWVKTPFSSIVFTSVMSQQAVPCYSNPNNTGSINVSKAKSLTITFDGYANAFINYLTEFSLVGDIDEKGNEIVNNNDINKKVLMRLTRGDRRYIYSCIAKEHTVTVQEDTGNETHKFTLTTRGIKNGD